MLIGYMRPLQDDLECVKQKQLFMKNHCDKIFHESHGSAKKRSALAELIDSLHEHDTVVVTELHALADSTHHLVDLLEEFERKGAHFISVTEKIDTSKKEGYSFGYIVKKIADFQSEVISSRTRKGIEKARQKGITTGRPRKPDANVQKAIMLYKSKKHTLKEIREETGISKSTLYRYLES